jgi:uncharacterized membrane protein YphA (DoxX/SURF4 family)
MTIKQGYAPIDNAWQRIMQLDGLPPLLLRLYLAPVMIQAGWNKWQGFDGVVEWFGNSEWGLGLPLPTLMAFLAVAAELIGGLLLIPGLLVRWVSIPLMVTMLVAAFSVHWPNGWLAIADPNSWLANEQVVDSAEKLAMAKEILQEYGNYEWLTSSGSFVILNNGIEFAITYFVMFFSLFFTGGGRYTSVDYWLHRKLIGDHNG